MRSNMQSSGGFLRLQRKQLILMGSSLLAVGLTLGVGLLAAQTPPSTGVTSCERYARQWYKQENPENFLGVSLSQNDFDEEKYEDKVGSQFISTVLSGSGQLRYKGEKPTAIQYTCLLENDKKAVFFHSAESKNKDVSGQCWAHFEPGDWDSLSDCLKLNLEQQEGALGQLEAVAKTQASKVDTQWPKANASQALSDSITKWRAYRDQECARRDAFRTGANHPDITHYECLINKTVDRIQDFHFEE